MHGLNAKEIAGNKHGAVLSIVDCKAEHTAEFVEHILTPLLKSVNKHFAVCFCIEDVICSNKLFSQIFVIIDLSVKSEHQGFVFIVNRLMTCINIDDAQSSKAHRDSGVFIKPAGVWTSVSDNIRHLANGITAVKHFTCKSANSAHNIISFQKKM